MHWKATCKCGMTNRYWPRVIYWNGYIIEGVTVAFAAGLLVGYML